jgi:hypothetical protein
MGIRLPFRLQGSSRATGRVRTRAVILRPFHPAARAFAPFVICASWAVAPHGGAAGAMALHERPSAVVTHRDACADAARPQTISPDFAPAIGRSPVWAIGFGGLKATAEDGQKVLWAIDGRFSDPVTVSGWRVRGHTPLQIQLVGSQHTTSAILDPHHPLASQPYHRGWPKPWAYFPSNIFATQTGCWVLRARWPGGSWRVRFRIDLRSAHAPRARACAQG